LGYPSENGVTPRRHTAGDNVAAGWGVIDRFQGGPITCAAGCLSRSRRLIAFGCAVVSGTFRLCDGRGVGAGCVRQELGLLVSFVSHGACTVSMPTGRRHASKPASRLRLRAAAS